jgi:putative aldouronate transport system permease protein
VPEWFRTIFVGSGIWQELGWGSIIYLSALSAINEEFYEAARIDGASRWRQLIHITLPCIMSTIVIMLIMRIGHVMNVSSEKVLLLYTPNTYETADVISTFVYRKGLLESNYGYSTAVGLFNAVINFLFLISVNQFSKKVSDSSLW